LAEKPLAQWANLVANLARGLTPGYALPLHPQAEIGATHVEPANEGAEGVVGRFWASASPLARQLAGLLAVATPRVIIPILKAVREELLPDAGQIEEAEVLLGGLLHISGQPNCPDVEGVIYDFKPGVRQVLAKGVSVRKAADAILAWEASLARRRDAGETLQVVIGDPAGSVDLGSDRPITNLKRDLLRWLGVPLQESGDQLDQIQLQTRSMAESSPSIYISYRISDSLDLVSRLDADLTREFGRAHVFRDKSRLSAGKDWDKELEENAKLRKVMLVVIGPTWQTVTIPDGDLKGFPRLHDEDDWVRREITLALDAGNIVLPLFLPGGTMPTKAWLKKCGLDRLHAKQGLPLRATDYDTDFAKLIGELRKHLPDLRPPPPPPPPEKVWRPSVAYPLQPAPHFSGREEVLKELSAWAVAADDPNRVVALVAAGGTGKTAIAERLLASLSNHTAAGVFVWSFYENPKTEAFLRAACEYFFGEAPKETGGLLERLQQGLRADNLPHLLILDGLELVQATGTTGRPRGELEDPLLKRFLRWLAAGLGTRAKALVTSRFPLPDLADWKGNGFRPIDLADLDPFAARAVLRRWGVRGTDPALDALSGSVHQHALTVDVLGSYLGTFHGGDPTQAPSFNPQFLADTDPKTARLHRVLTSYAEKLPPRERDLLARLSVFPRGVGVDVIGSLIEAGGEVAGTLVGCGQSDLLKLLERLRALGLVFRYDTGGGIAFTAHPFLRGFFEKLLGVKDPNQIYEVVRKKMVAGLVESPSIKKPIDSGTWIGTSG
jgi:hypothetical protein